MASITQTETQTQVHTEPQTTLNGGTTLDFIDIPQLDFRLLEEPEGEQKLTVLLKDALENSGCFFIVNSGLTSREVDQQFALGKEILSLPEENKMKYRANLEAGDYNGYRPAGSIEQFPGLRDNWECYHIFKFNEEHKRSHPSLVTNNKDSIERFHKYIHKNLGHTVLHLIERALQVPENSIVKYHQYEDNCSSFLRYVKYRPRSPQLNAQYQNFYVREHTDYGTITFLFSQHISGLQLKTQNGDWKDVPHLPGAILVIMGDMLHFWTNGYIRGSVHRVVAPKSEQMYLERHGLIYFMRSVPTAPLNVVDSPLLLQLGHLEHKEENQKLAEARNYTMGQWVHRQTQKNWIPHKEQKPDDNELYELFDD